MLKATIEADAEPGSTAPHVDRFDEALQTVARSITQVRLHERLLRLAGVRLDRAGATLLFKLSAHGDSLRVTDLAEILGVDTPTVTRKVQQLERDGMVVRQNDPDDRRASRIRLTPAGRRTIERVRRARRAWLEQLLQNWDEDDLSALADLLSRFALDLEQDLDDAVTELATAPVDEEAAGAEHRRILVILGALMMGMALAALDQTIVATALPTIAGDLHGLNHLSWVVTAYLLTTCISTPLWGKLGDLYGRKALFQLAIVIFLVGSVLSGLSQSMAELIGFRAIQGIGAGGLMVGSQAIMGDVVSARQRGKYMGYFGVVFGVTNVAGPLLGGFFTEHLSWRWIFYINVPLGIVALFVVASVLHLPVMRVPHKIDWAGTAFLSVGVTCIILLTTWAGSQYAWGSPVTIGVGLIALASLGIFCFIETRVSEPIIPLWLFKNRTFTATSAVGFIIGFSMFGAIIYLPLYLQVVHGASPTLSGLELLPMIGGMLLTFISSGRLVTRTGRYKVFPIVGTGVLSLGLLSLTQLGPHTPYGEVAVLMFITGLGIGLVMQVLVVAVQNAVPYSALGVATATSTFFRTIGGAFGVAVLGAVFANRLISQLKLHATSAELKLVSGSNVTANPAQIDHLPAAQRAFVVSAFSHSVETAFLVAVPFVVLGFIMSWLIKEIPLRTTAPVPTRRPDGHQPQAGDTAGDAVDESLVPTPVASAGRESM